MRNLQLKIWSVAFLSLGVSALVAAPAQAQANCAPFSGTIYGALSRSAPGQPRAWHMLGDFTIGREVFPATISVQMMSIVQDPDNWQGAETWTFDFGGGHTVQLVTSFVTEHMTNAGGVWHIREVGTFVNGTGGFKHAFGNLTAEGPFGPGVILHGVEGLPMLDARYFWVAPSQGMICGMNRRD